MRIKIHVYTFVKRFLTTAEMLIFCPIKGDFWSSVYRIEPNSGVFFHREIFYSIRGNHQVFKVSVLSLLQNKCHQY